MKKSSIKGFIVGFFTCMILSVSTMSFASGILQNIQVTLNGINLQVNGKSIEANNFVYNGTTYVPLRTIADALGKQTNYDLVSNTVNIIDSTQQSNISVNNENEISYPDGSKYIGQIKDGKKDGYGILYYPSNDEKTRKMYYGFWKNDLRDGYGTLIWVNENSCTGNWTLDQPNGNCVEYYKNQLYVGNYTNGIIEGKGSMYFITSGDKYIGEFKNSVRNGQGVYTFDNGKKQSGTWKDDKIISSNNSGNSTDEDKDNQNTEYIKKRIDEYESELDDLKDQIKDAKNDKSVQTLVEKSDGTYDYEYTYDEEVVKELQDEYDELLDEYNDFKAKYNID